MATPVGFSAPPLWRGRLGLLAACAGLAVAYSFGALLPFWFLDVPESGAAFFPAAGLTLAVLALTDKRLWPLWLAVIGTCELVVDVTHGQPVTMAIGFALANTVEPLVGAATLREHYFRQRPNLRRQLVVFHICGVAFGPAVGAVLGATTVTVFGGAPNGFAVAGQWWLGDALGVLVVATPVLAHYLRSRRDTAASPLETGLIVTVATAVMLVPALLWHRPMIYAVLPVLCWAAFRGGTRTVSFAGFAVAFTANWAAVTGRASDLLVGVDGGHLVFLQVYLGITLLTGISFAIEIEERRRLEAAARKAELDRMAAEAHLAEIEATERRRLATETHDIVGHGLNVMLLQAGAARRVVLKDPAQAESLLSALEEVGRRACRDLDLVLAAERTSTGAPERGLAAVPGLVALLQDAGLQIERTMQVPDRTLPTIVDRTAYRIVRECLTNVAKHAPTAATSVRVDLGQSDLHLEVVDDGGGRRSTVDLTGLGIAGMRTWVANLSGELVATPLPQGGFAVMATLPTAGRDR
jgi:signal transduction histidine kinase